MKKALIVSTIFGFIASFERNDVKILQGLGYEVHCVCNCTNYTKTWKTEELLNTGIIVHNITFSRNAFSKDNFIAYRKLKKLIEIEKFDLVHSHTPVGGVMGRIAAHSNHVPKIIYTAHGFHFYIGGPLKNWIMYYPIEKWLSRYTDILITINKEDYKRASYSFHAKKTVYIPGVGVDTEKFGADYNGDGIRSELGIDGFMLLSVGELNENKNHEAVIRAIAGLDVEYVIVGKGELEEHLKQVAQECRSNVILTGYRSDVADFYVAADAYILPSVREGLNVSLMEAMASGLPCLCGNIRGNIDLIDGKGGYTFDPKSVEQIRKTINQLLASDKNSFGEYNQKKIQSFSTQTVNEQMTKIYKEV